MTRNKSPPHDGLHLLPSVYRPFTISSPTHNKLIPPNNSIINKFKRKGHFAKDCPHKREKSIRLVKHLQATTDYSPEKDELEFYFSEHDEANDETVFALHNSSDDSDSDQSQVIFHQQLLSLDTTVPIPSIKLQILPSKFQRPVPAIGLIDIGAQRSMLNPHILPPEYWIEYEEHFKAVNGKLFTTSLITKKPIGSHEEHRQLLTQFYDIVQSHGIMLSVKKSTIATDNIEFLVQQFLGIINYIRDFIPHVDHYTHHLSALLKKKPPEWNADHTTAVTTLKQITQNPPPLKLITDGKRILQTAASDESWGAILLEEINRKEHFIAYPSGQFSDTQKHYHSVFKEILVVKNGIKKFKYHLIGHHFLIRMDNSAFPNILNFKGLTLDPSRETTEDVFWYIWCLTVLYATKLVLPITPTLEHLLNPDKATSLTWTLLEWFSPIPWWRKKLQQLSETYNLERMLASEAQLFTSVFIIHRPYFQHLDTNLFWTQDQVYEWFTAPHPAVIDNEIQSNLHNYLCQLDHQTPPHKDIFHTSLGPQHDLIMIPTPSAISKPKSIGIIIKEEKPDYTDFLYQDSQDPWEEFLPLSQHLQQFPQPTMYDPGSSSQPSKVDKATQMPSPKSQSSPSKPGCRKDYPYPPCRGPHYLVEQRHVHLCIRTLISTRRPQPKEYIQSSRLDQCALQATSTEQYVTLEIPSELLSNWKREGYIHLHLGGIRLILTLHGRKGLPVTARLAILDTRFKQYQDAVIGTVLTTLHAGSVLLTFYPNFNLFLQDPNLPTTLKVQVQIQGAEQISSAKIATLHHQLVYRLQNHAVDLPTPEHHSDTFMTSESMFERRQDGTVRMTFKPPPSASQKPHRLSFTYSSMITAVQTAQEDLPITGFNSEGYPVYPAKQNGHFLWDVPGSGMCDPNCPYWDDWEEDDDTYATSSPPKCL
ncbi:hypothetical protein KPL70_003617 [Citrus sinensis]|nr:hypothetical protein KPL70_003617 [Citrus sinensis]